MTRRKYVKTCMAFGIPRNTARKLAESARANNIPYLQASEAIFWHLLSIMIEERLTTDEDRNRRMQSLQTEFFAVGRAAADKLHQILEVAHE